MQFMFIKFIKRSKLLISDVLKGLMEFSNENKFEIYN